MSSPPLVKIHFRPFPSENGYTVDTLQVKIVRVRRQQDAEPNGVPEKICNDDPAPTAYAFGLITALGTRADAAFPDVEANRR